MKSALTYSQKMKQYRFEHQLKQADIAKKLGISQQMYSLIEKGSQKPKIDFILLYQKGDWSRFDGRLAATYN